MQTESGALTLGDDEMRARVSGQGCQFDDRGGKFNYLTAALITLWTVERVVRWRCSSKESGMKDRMNQVVERAQEIV